jgi:uncharacterized protein
MNKKNDSTSAKSSDKSSTTKSARGFAAMDPEKQREIAKKGGAASHGGNRGGNKK